MHQAIPTASLHHAFTNTLRLPVIIAVLLLHTVAAGQCWDHVSIGMRHSVGVQVDGTLWTWGWNDVGQLGNGTNTPVNIPQQVGFDSDWVLAVAAGSFDVVLNTNGKHTAAIKADGTLWTWGGNDHGQLGDGTLVDRNSPAQVGTDTWVAVQCGALHTVALRSDSTLWAWGYNTYGQLGLGNLVEGHTPTQVGTDTDWWQIVSTDMHCLALKSDSSLWSWGLNNYYQLGFFNDNQNKVVPTHVGSATNWRSIATGRYFSFAVKGNNTLWGWGSNDSGQLGLGVVAGYHPVPQQIGTGTMWEAVACGDAHTLAQRTDGSLWGWGFNYFGQLGLNNNTWNYLSPQSLPNGVGSSAVSAGYYSSGSLRADSSLWTWGGNDHGNLGVGDMLQREVPTAVVCTFTTAVPEGSLPMLKAYPMPTEALLFLDRTVDALWLYDLHGRSLLTLQSTDRLDLTGVQAGTYLLHARVNGQVVHVRVMKR